MDRIIAVLSALPTWVLVVIAIVACLQLALQVYALLDLSRRDTVLGGRKWLWVLVIIAGNLLGAIIYLGIARVEYQPGPGDGERAGSEKATRRAIDNLYGDRK
ncbi:MAG TPA: PLD nuclease N-terminal domain-containing protein [Gemmatimonadales bacterium]|nr:PLD nuclease N-terminal domain-containing protein [Gemmatimonadales bacterium]